MLSTSKTKTSGSSPDPYFRYVNLLLPGNGTNGAKNNTFIDSSGNSFSITGNGTPTQGAFSPYGGLWSNYWDGGANYLNIGSASGLDMGTGDFTVEFYCFSGAWTYQENIIASGGFVSGSTRIGKDATFGMALYSNNGTGVIVSEGNNTSFPKNQWVHYAITRSGNSFTLYRNGASVGTGTSSGAINFNTSSSTLIGSDWANDYWNGFVSNLRVVKGSVVYTTAFTPPTTPLTAISGTQLLMCQSNRFIDNSSNGFTLTPTGAPSVSNLSPFAPVSSYTASTNGGSGFFGGADYIANTSSVSASVFGTGDFTAEAWVFIRTLYVYNYRIIYEANPAFGGAFQIYFDANNGIFYGQYGAMGNQILAASAVPVNQWFHIAVCRSGAGTNNVSVYANGIRTAQYTDTTNFGVGGLSVGARNTGVYYLTGYISDVRMVTGTAVYTSNFTPPTTPLAAISGTSLLCNFTNAGIFDYSKTNNLITAGDAQISTSVKKFGTGAISFGGTGYLPTTDTGNQLGSGDFTVEGWVYLNATGTAYGVISKGTPTTGWSVNITSGNKLQFTYSSTNLTGATSLSSATWYHFAVVRNGAASGNLVIYLNGAVEATSGSAVTDNFNQTSTLYVGADRSAGSKLNGYVDDLRVTVGIARYTAAFTVPSSAFPTY